MEMPAYLVFLFLLSLLLLFIRTRSRSNLNLPPSPPRLPLIGNLHQLGTHPHRSFRALSQRYGPLMLLQLGQVPALVVSSADMMKEIIKNHDIAFSSRPKTNSYQIRCLYRRPKTRRIFGKFSPHVGECLAVREGLCLAHLCGFQNLCAECCWCHTETYMPSSGIKCRCRYT